MSILCQVATCSGCSGRGRWQIMYGVLPGHGKRVAYTHRSITRCISSLNAHDLESGNNLLELISLSQQCKFMNIVQTIGSEWSSAWRADECNPAGSVGKVSDVQLQIRQSSLQSHNHGLDPLGPKRPDSGHLVRSSIRAEDLNNTSYVPRQQRVFFGGPLGALGRACARGAQHRQHLKCCFFYSFRTPTPFNVIPDAKQTLVHS